MRLALNLLVACGCPANKPVRSGAGSAAPPLDLATTCEGVKPRVEQLYCAEAEAKEPTRVAETVADNTQMVMNDCVKQPARAPCLAKAATVSELEKDCLLSLAEEGTEAP